LVGGAADAGGITIDSPAKAGGLLPSAEDHGQHGGIVHDHQRDRHRPHQGACLEPVEYRHLPWICRLFKKALQQFASVPFSLFGSSQCYRQQKTRLALRMCGFFVSGERGLAVTLNW
jgi:hypothetical protein